MSMYFSYRLGRSPHPVITLGGRQQRPLPVVDVGLVGPKTTIVRAALLDTGADDTVFKESDARNLGMDLSNAPRCTVAGVGGQTCEVAYAQITLRLSDGKEHREWPAWVGFTSAPMVHRLLGFGGCLQFFDAHFRGQLEMVELTVNGFYPGK